MEGDDYEYHETTSEMDEGDGVPPPGPGWQLADVFWAGTIRVHRWKRLMRQQQKFAVEDGN